MPPGAAGAQRGRGPAPAPRWGAAGLPPCVSTSPWSSTAGAGSGPGRGGTGMGGRRAQGSEERPGQGEATWSWWVPDLTPASQGGKEPRGGGGRWHCPSPKPCPWEVEFGRGRTGGLPPAPPGCCTPWGGGFTPGRGEGAPGDLPGSFLGAACCHHPHLPPATTLIFLPVLTLSWPRGAHSLPTAPGAQFSNSASS